MFLFFKEPSKTSRRVFFRTGCFRLFRDAIESTSFGKIIVASPNYRFTATMRAMLARFHTLVDRFFFTQELHNECAIQTIDRDGGALFPKHIFPEWEKLDGYRRCCSASIFRKYPRTIIGIPRISLPLLIAVSLAT